MSEDLKSNKISDFLNRILKRGTHYTKRAKEEFTLMTLLSQKNNAYYELGKYVYEQIKKNNTNYMNELMYKTIISDIYKIEDQEKKIKNK